MSSAGGLVFSHFDLSYLAAEKTSTTFVAMMASGVVFVSSALFFIISNIGSGICIVTLAMA
jgi:hypothetical protein